MRIYCFNIYKSLFIATLQNRAKNDLRILCIILYSLDYIT